MALKEIIKMNTFSKDGQNYQITKVTHTDVYAKKLDVDGKGKKGRPSKFAKADVESLLNTTLEVTEDQTVDPVVTETTVSEVQ